MEDIVEESIMDIDGCDDDPLEAVEYINDLNFFLVDFHRLYIMQLQGLANYTSLNYVLFFCNSINDLTLIYLYKKKLNIGIR